MWELDYKESWIQKNWCFWTVVLEKTLKSPLDCKGIKPVNPKGNQSILIGRTDDEAEMPILWPSDAKNWLIGKASDVGKDWRQDEKGMTEDEIVGWHNRLDGHKFEQALGVGRWTGKPGVLQSMGSQRVVHDWATDLNWTEFWKEYLMLTSYLSLIRRYTWKCFLLGRCDLLRSLSIPWGKSEQWILHLEAKYSPLSVRTCILKSRYSLKKWIWKLHYRILYLFLFNSF